MMANAKVVLYRAFFSLFFSTVENALNPVDIKLKTAQLAEGWADIVIQRWHESIVKYHIHGLYGGLWNSFKKELVKNNGDVDAVIFRFLKYGRFVDMGVGRGVSVGDAGTAAFSAARNDDGTLKRYRRVKKPWYSKTYYREVQTLKQLFTNEIHQDVNLQIREAMNLTVTVNA